MVVVREDRRVIVTRRLTPGVIDALAERYDVILHDDVMPMPRERLLRQAPGASALLTTLDDRVDEELLAAAGDSLRVVANHAVGTHNVDSNACRERGITVCNTPGVLTSATADLTWALILAAARRIGEGERWLRAGHAWRWSPDFMLGLDLEGARMGIVGMGEIGQAVARRANGFGMKIDYHNRKQVAADIEKELGATWHELDDLLRHSDVVVVSCPLTDKTRNLLDAARLNLLRPSSVLVTITASVVDELHLARVLEDGRIFAAAVDNFSQEPHVPDELRRQERAVLVPHLGSATVKARAAMGTLAVDNVIAVLSEKPPPTPVSH